MANLLLQILVTACFLGVVIVLFFEDKDYIYYTFAFIIIAGIATAYFIPEARSLDFYISQIEWDVVFFLITMFAIVEVLKENLIFDELARLIVVKYGNSPRKLFYVICTVSTLLATIVEDLSVAMIFAPIIIVATRKLNMRPAAYLLGMTICINIAATLTPFGSAQNIIITDAFNLDILWFIMNLGPYFVLCFLVTLVLLDKLSLSKDIDFCKQNICAEEEELGEVLKDRKVERNQFVKNLIALGIFIVLLVVIPELYLAGLIALLLFVLINPLKQENKDKKHISLSYYLKQVDYKLIYFFICLFIFVGLMELNGTIGALEDLIEGVSSEDEFILALVILVITSLLSGFLDNTPVTIIFIPIIQILIDLPEFYRGPLVIAFILGINLGGNFLPQGSAADMMTLEVSRDNKVKDLSYRRLFKVGGLFAALHIVLGIGYLAFIIFVI
ncbi:MAG: putative Arsenical pump membrane protein [Promethearchaeota archaeon]|nr:MAG: putative Arsenical pump membrane protein [Candidatus Lokiarchaeota archaeon]